MNFSKIDRLIDTMPLRGIPGCEFVVTLGGKEIYRRASGLANAAKGKPVDEKTLWWIYSASKISTCVSAMQLVEQGRISLDDPVSKYLPAFSNMKVQTPDGVKTCDVPMRINHLFTMTGGLDYDLSEPAVKEALETGKSTVEVAEALASKTLLFAPGEHYRYSLCHDVLGAVVSKVSGKTLSEYMKENLWLPLGMEDTGFFPTEEQKTRLADMYTFDYSKGVSNPIPLPDNRYEDVHYESGGGGVFSCAGDYAKLMGALSMGGVSPDGRRILKPETVKMLEVNRLSDECRKDLWRERLFGYGWGLCGRVHMNADYSLSRSSVGEFGWDGAAAAFALADRPKGIALFFATHVHNCGYAYCWVHPKLRDLVYEAIED